MGNYDNNFLCMTCGSPQIGKDPHKDPFIQNGQGGEGASMISPCKFCGGVVLYIEDEANAQSALTSARKKLGLNNPS